MALYDSLRIYKGSYDLLLDIFRSLGGVQRDIKFTLVESLKKDMLRMLTLIYRANATTDKVPVLEEGKALMMEVKVQLRLLKDMRCIDMKRYMRLSERAETVSKELSGWYKYAVNMRRESRIGQGRREGAYECSGLPATDSGKVQDDGGGKNP